MQQRHRLNRYIALILLTTLALLGQHFPLASAQSHKAPPRTRTEAVVESIHGVKIADPYRWLENQDATDTRAWIDEQNKYARTVLDSVPARARIRTRIEELLKIDTIGVPTVRGKRYFFSKRRADQNQPVIYFRESGKDQILIDPNTMSADQTTSAFLANISRDGELVAYGIRQGGADETTINFMEVTTRKELGDRLPLARYFGIAIKPDKSGFYYSRFLKEGPRVFYHEFGTDIENDARIFGDGYGPETIIGSSLSEDGKYLTISVSHGSAAKKVEVYSQNIESNGPIVPIVNDLEATFGGGVGGDTLFLLTNWQAPNRRIVAVDLKKPARGNWKTIVPEGSSVISGFSMAGGRLFVNYLENVIQRIRVFSPEGKSLREIKFPTIGSGGISGRWSSDEAFMTFNSFGTPPTIYSYDVSTGKRREWARINVPIKAKDIEVKQVWYQSKDGTRVPMFVAHRKGLKLDGRRPTLLTGYGGFRVSQSAGYSARALYWIENGGMYALPNLRGGGEFGEKWHQAGMRDRKQNVFDDFIAAAEWLIKSNYTNPAKLAISGGSNGGLLVGAAMTQRPELFQAVICSYPLLDMVRYHKFLVARFWVPEYGSSEDPDQFRYLHAYSPYHQVKKGTKYPAVLFITGDSDTRVDPLHARKMTALVQASTGSYKPVLLHYDTKAGHSGGTPVAKQVEDLTDQLAFLFWQLGIEPT